MPSAVGPHVGVVENDHRGFPSQLEVHTLQIGAAAAATSIPARTLPVIDTIAGIAVGHQGAARCHGPHKPR